MFQRRLAHTAMLVLGAVLVAGSLALACQSFSATSDDRLDAGAPSVDGAPSPNDAGGDAGGDAAPSSVGCSDGTREGFVGLGGGIAACQGGWKIGGVRDDAKPSCGRSAGNSSTNPSGAGCGAQDLCATGWHVCRDAADVALHRGSAAGEICDSRGVDGGVTFYATAQPSDGNAACGTDGGVATDDVFGCGDFRFVTTLSCQPLNAAISVGFPLDGWDVGLVGNAERSNVTKGTGPGGVLCCSDG